MSAPVVVHEVKDGIVHIVLNRPETANGMDVSLLKALHDAVMECHSRPNLRVVVLSGAGKHFCAGGDVKDFASKGEGLPDYLREATAWLQNATRALIELPAPVIAKVQGYAAGGGGLGLVCASDFVIAADTARFMSGAVRVGMAPDGGVTATLTQLVGLRKAMDIILTNPTLTAEEAASIGLITRVAQEHHLAAEVDALAESLAESAPLALAASKRLLWRGLGASVHDVLPEEARTVSELSGTEDAREGLAAVIERRAPKFVGR
ncbi:MAG TPA: enoyl-CoA hydratase-related protein [Nocardioidaceae bacterium]|nr:enoyl-CoA hydratase-related protein [Nocardioidaceae bacterium]